MTGIVNCAATLHAWWHLKTFRIQRWKISLEGNAHFINIPESLACCGLSCFLRPWTAIASIPVSWNSSASLIVSTTSFNSLNFTCWTNDLSNNKENFEKCDAYLILQVIGTLIFFTKVFNMLFARSGSESKAAPIPPFRENYFGYPILMSIAATSFSTILETINARSALAVPSWRTTFPSFIGHVLNTIVPSILSTKSIVPSTSVKLHE